MADKRIDRIDSQIHSPGFEIQPSLLAEVLLDAIGPQLFEPDAPLVACSQTPGSVTEPIRQT